MSSETKSAASASNFEVDPHEHSSQSHLRATRLVDGVRVSLTALGLLLGLTVLGTSGNTLSVYNTTSVPTNNLLPLWPDEFDLRPTVALVVGSAIVVFASILSLITSKVPKLRSRSPVHTPVSLGAPFLGFAAAMIAMIFFYAVNSSTTVDTLQSWSCQWESVGMDMQPYFGTLCRESKTALYLSVILVPVEAVILSFAAYQTTLERKAVFIAQPRKQGSPVPSA
ncbi:hypothetical protein JX265_009646 [Neoarthrinium moseri]|uniref:Uncharacterized protein n=1 Tax=Neoarthrinium moseri TaxID=1658444 RepID=A0A9P9WFD7_9PEZI|nr:uncharacterized protein JN550_010882 [Neoarthrinium moseri]KAI1844091.1 hypothetical protein JX266_009764 [Neoarthrinium moseri]KAI1861027.1 hypothetical protein JX265_009646 [Neoarthrinium moseri]KAI1861352.1 hypothetical protein JN550_010882 [Neoarthrinium moseri]